MNIKDDKNIKVLNYNEFNLCLKSNVRAYMLMPFTDEPTFEYMTFDEISYINANTNGIKSGLVRFEVEKESEIYKALGIKDWDKIITNSEIETILKNPTKESLQKLIDIKDKGVFERVRNIFVRLKESPNADISIQTAKLINKRYEELKRGIITSEIVLSNADTKQNFEKENENLRDELATLRKLIDEMRKSSNTSNNSNSISTETEENQPKRGRPKK